MQAAVKKYLSIFLCLALFFSASGLAIEAFFQETGQPGALAQELQRQGGSLNTKIQQLSAARDKYKTFLEEGSGNATVLSREVSNMQAELDLLEQQVRTLEKRTQEFLSTNPAHSSREILEKNMRDALNALGLKENPYVPAVPSTGAPQTGADTAITSSADFRKALEDKFGTLRTEFEQTREAWVNANQAIAANKDASKPPQLIDEFGKLDQKMSSIYFELKQTADALDIPQEVFEKDLENYLVYDPPTAQEVVDLTKAREQLRVEAQEIGVQVAKDVDEYTDGIIAAVPATQGELAELGVSSADELGDLAEAAIATDDAVTAGAVNEQALENIPAKQKGIITRMKEKTPEFWGKFKTWLSGSYERMRSLKEKIGEGTSKLTGKIREIKGANRRLGSPMPGEHLTVEQYLETYVGERIKKADNLIEYADAQIKEIEERYGLSDSSSEPVLTDSDKPVPPQAESKGIVVTGKETVEEETEIPSPEFEEKLVDLEGIVVQVTKEDWEGLRDKKISPLTLAMLQKAMTVTVGVEKKNVEIKIILDQPRIFVQGVKPGDHAVFEFRFTDANGKEVFFREEYTIPSRNIWIHGWFSGIKETATQNGCATVRGCLAVIGKEFAKKLFD